MPTKTTGSKTGTGLKIPDFLGLKDLITIISVAVSLTLAWGVFTTRITVLEKEVVRLQEDNNKLSGIVDKLQDNVSRHEVRGRENSLLIDQLYQQLGKQQPNRSGK